MLIRFALCSLLFAQIYSVGAAQKSLDALGQANNSFEAGRLEEEVWAVWLESDSAVVDVLMERALKAEQLQRYDIAEALYDRVIQTRPNYAEAWHRRAMINYRAERLEEAIFDLEQAISLQPRHFAGWTALGQMFLRLGAYDEALNAFNKALKAHPFFAQAQHGRKLAAKEAEGIPL